MAGHPFEDRSIRRGNGQGARLASAHGPPSATGATVLVQRTRGPIILHDFWLEPLGTPTQWKANFDPVFPTESVSEKWKSGLWLMVSTVATYSRRRPCASIEKT